MKYSRIEWQIYIMSKKIGLILLWNRSFVDIRPHRQLNFGEDEISCFTLLADAGLNNVKNDMSKKEFKLADRR